MSKGLVLACLALAAPLSGAEFKPVLDAHLGGGYSSMAQALGSWNASGRILFLPLLTLGKKDAVTPVMLVDLANYQPAIDEETFFVQRGTLLFKPGWTHSFDALGKSTLYASAKRTVNLERNEDPWFQGLYDYEEYGGGGSWALGAPKLEELKLGLGYFRRSYINYHFKTPSGAKNYYVKDAEISKIDLEAALPPGERGQLKAAYSLDLRNYTDSYLVKRDGSLDLGTLRAEQLHQLQLKAAKASGAWARGLKLAAALNQSNQNSFDYTLNIPLEDYFSYYSFSLKPEITWLLQGKPEGHRVGLSYEGVLRNYVHRNIRWKDGTKTEGAQADTEHHFDLDGFYAFSRRLGVYLNLSYQVVRSNQAYEPGIRYSYDLFQSLAGLAIRY